MFESPLSKTQVTEWVKFEEAASLNPRSSMTLTMISNGDKCGVKGLQAHEFLSHGIKDGIKWRLSLMCQSCRETMEDTSWKIWWRDVFQISRHRSSSWPGFRIFYLLKETKGCGGRFGLNVSIWVGTERWAGPVRHDPGSTFTTAIFEDTQHNQHGRAGRASGLNWSPPELTFLRINFEFWYTDISHCVGLGE